MIELNNKQKAALAVGSLALAFASGRFLAPTKVKIETKTVEVVKTIEVEKKDSAKDRRRKYVTTEKHTPDGGSEKTVIITDDNSSSNKVDIAKDTTDSKTTDQIKEITRDGTKVTVSALAGVNPFQPTDGVSYGASVSKPILGPIAVGLWFLNNGTCGASAGLTF